MSSESVEPVTTQEGKVVEAQIETTDILPTVLDLLSILVRPLCADAPSVLTSRRQKQATGWFLARRIIP